MAVNAKRYTFWPTKGMRDENDMPPLWSVQQEMVLASDYQDMWDTALKRWQTIQRQEGAISDLEAALEKYGRHLRGCKREDMLPCDCGFFKVTAFDGDSEHG
jgi:hypothetical protein